MLRLKPTEIVLTSADMERTRQRMERRKAEQRMHAAPPGRTRLPPTASVSPRIRRGAQRSRDAALASLGNIPILRPQEVVRTSLDDDLEPALEQSAPRADAASHHVPTLSLPQHLPTFGSLELPFRAVARALASEDSPLKSQASSSGLEQEGTAPEEDHDTASTGRTHAATDGFVEHSDIPGTSIQSHTYTLHQDNSRTPVLRQQIHMMSPLRGGQDLTPANNSSNSRHTEEPQSIDRSTEQSPISGSDDSPTLQLHGYFNDRRGYTFRRAAPQTEPRPKTQSAIRYRTVSSSSDPSHSLHVQKPRPVQSPVEDVFWNPSTRTSPSDRHTSYSTVVSTHHPVESPLNNGSSEHLDSARNSSQRLSSEKSSSSSLPYSFYELAESQHSNSDLSQEDLEHSQYDGAGPSRQAVKGAYHSIRLSGNHAPRQPCLDQSELSQIPKSPTPHPNMRERSGLSPLPVHPYSRAPNGQYVFRPSIGLLTSDDVLGAEQDAVIAVQRNISSPLDLVQERATAYMHRISAQIQTNQAHNNPRGRQDFRIRRPRDDTQFVPQQMTFEGGNSRTMSVNNAPYRPRSGNHNQPQYRIQPARYIRGGQIHARTDQRSSENVPVSLSIQEVPPRPHTNVQNPNRPPGNSAGHLRYSLPHPPRPRDASNRPSLMEANSERSDIVQHVQMMGHSYPTNSMRGPRGQPLPGFRQGDPSVHGVTHQTRPSLRHVTPTRRPSVVPPAYVFHRSLSRGPPSTSTTLDSASGVTSRRPPSTSTTFDGASGVISRHPPSVSAVPHSGNAFVGSRRLPLQHQDEENSGEAQREQEVMREELATVGLRYGVNEGAQDRMDETPPRIGRIERRIAD